MLTSLFSASNVVCQIAQKYYSINAKSFLLRKYIINKLINKKMGARCSSVVRAFAHGAMGRRIDPSWGGPIELFLVPASAPRLV